MTALPPEQFHESLLGPMRRDTTASEPSSAGPDLPLLRQALRYLASSHQPVYRECEVGWMGIVTHRAKVYWLEFPGYLR